MKRANCLNLLIKYKLLSYDELTSKSYEGGFFVYNQPEVALEQYELEIIQMTKTRAGYWCETDKGHYLLKTYSGSAKRVEILAQMLKELGSSGFKAEKIVYTKDGSPIARDDWEVSYILKSTFQGRECNPADIKDVCKAMEELASFHKNSPCGQCPDYMKESMEKYWIHWQRHNRELIKLRNYLRTRKNKNIFELQVMNSFEYFYSQGKAVEEWVNTLKRPEDYEGEIMGWCHHDYNFHNVIFEGAQGHIINFENAIFGIRVADIAAFLRKVMEKNNWQVEMGQRMLDSYKNLRPLSQLEFQILGKMIQYPEKFWKVCNRYYNSNKAWGSERYMEKLDKIIKQEPQRVVFLEKIFSIIC